MCVNVVEYQLGWGTLNAGVVVLNCVKDEGVSGRDDGELHGGNTDNPSCTRLCPSAIRHLQVRG